MVLLVYLLTFLGVLSQHSATRSSHTAGLTIELVHPNSPDSPFYIANLTQKETMQRLLSLSMARARTLHKPFGDNNFTQILRVQPEVHTAGYGLIMVKVNIGTFGTVARPYKTYLLHLDTSSEVTWLQCEACLQQGNRCFRQLGNPFPNSRSQSYHPFPCDHHSLCFPGECDQGFCSYHFEFKDGLETRGTLASEAFTFPSSNGNTETAPSLVFGCGSNNTDHLGTTTGKEAGIFGLGWGPRSFVSQMINQNVGKYSYCLQQWENVVQGAHSYLKFGADIAQEEGFSSTALRKVGNRKHYYLNLEGISVAGVRLNIPRSLFALREDGSGGTIIDTGSTFTFLINGAYRTLKTAVSTHFRRLQNYRRLYRRGLPFDLCFERQRPRQDAMPWITLHFLGGADLVIKPENAFVWSNTRQFCLGMVPHPLTIIGAYQQSNIRFIYDRKRMLLLFKPEDCHQNP